MSDLLNSASLVLIPSGYKEDTVYSVVPSDGSGDLSFTRASNGTRINSAGLVEVCPWNLLEQSSTFNVSPWAFVGGTTLTSGITDINGTSNAFRYQATSGSYKYGYETVSSTIGQVYTHSIYAKCSSGTQQFKLTDAQQGGGSLQTVTTEWQRFTFTLTATGGNIAIELGSDGTNALDIYICFAQTNIGATAKPYFPTTDRLNVPRLTYQNGGGGCPSLLLEKQSTNIMQYSQDLANAWFSIFDATATGNSAISPDGTQNATNLSFDAVGAARLEKAIGGTYESQTHTVSVYAKVTSGTQTFRLKCTHAGVVDYLSGDFTVTTEWQRFTFTQAFGATVGSGIVGGIQNGSNSTAKNILFYGFQLEPNTSYPTSYIPTTSASATRVADACFKTGISSLIGQTQGTIFVSFKLTNPNAEIGNILQIGAGSSRIYIYKNSATQNIYQLATNSSSGYNFVDTSALTTPIVNVAIGYKDGDNAFYVNGSLLSTASATTNPNSFSQLLITDNANQTSVEIVEAVLFTTRLSNSELASLTSL
jgi:hypothetical protein